MMHISTRSVSSLTQSSASPVDTIRSIHHTSPNDDTDRANDAKLEKKHKIGLDS